MDDRRFAWVGGRSLVVGVCAGLMLSSFIHSVFDTRGVWRRIAAADFRFNPPLLHAPETHEELDALTATTTPVEFKDALYHKGEFIDNRTRPPDRPTARPSARPPVRSSARPPVEERRDVV